MMLIRNNKRRPEAMSSATREQRRSAHGYRYAVLLSIGVSLLLGPVMTWGDTLPDEVRWALEDLYVPDRGKWPLPVQSRDLDRDGVEELVAPVRGCTELADCEVELFLCKQFSAGSCLEYCYAGSGIFRALQEDAAKLKCERTC